MMVRICLQAFMIQLKGNKMYFSGVLVDENSTNPSPGSCCVSKMDVCFCVYPQTIYIKWLFVHSCLEISKVYVNGLPMLGSLLKCTVDVYTNKLIFGQLKLTCVM